MPRLTSQANSKASLGVIFLPGGKTIFVHGEELPGFPGQRSLHLMYWQSEGLSRQSHSGKTGKKNGGFFFSELLQIGWNK